MTKNCYYIVTFNVKSYLAIDGLTSNLGGSNIPTTPTKVKLTSYLANLVESSKSISLGFIGASQVAKAKHLKVSRPVPKKMINYFREIDSFR